MTADRFSPLRSSLLKTFLLLALGVGLWFVLDWFSQVGEGGGGFQRGALEADIKSEYSRIKIRKVKNQRTLWFVRDNGDEVVESIVDLDNPHDLIVDYTKFMFLSYLFRPRQEKILIVGLGGGSMIHFLKHYDPKAKIDVVEIDPAVVKIADKYFGVGSGGNVNIMAKDGFEFLKNTDSRYDAIYMDAFLKPSRDTDTTGVPLRLKTIKFYKEIQKKLVPDGVVVFNLNPHSTVDGDIRNVQDAFPQTYVFQLPNYGGYVVVGSMTQKRLSYATILNEATELDRRFKTSYSYRGMAQRMER